MLRKRLSIQFYTYNNNYHLLYRTHYYSNHYKFLNDMSYEWYDITNRYTRIYYYNM